MTREINLGNLVIPIIKPQKGIDYYTEAEKQEMVSSITNSVNEVILPQEQTRQSNETTRQYNESTRQNQETSRVGNETSREIAESSRVDAETIRKNNETSRVSAEETRTQTFNTQMEAVDVAIAGISTSQESFNQNATSKTNDFNTNATNKTTAFDENATSKTEAFDEHTEEIQIKLATIEEGAEVNIIETVRVNGTSLTPINKEVDITVPTKVSDLLNDSGFGTYTKPSGGIPKTDLADDVQTSLETIEKVVNNLEELDSIVDDKILTDSSRNIFSAKFIIKSGIDHNTGIFTQDSSSYAHSTATEDYIEIEENKSYIITNLELVGSGTFKNIFFYDEDKEIITLSNNTIYKTVDFDSSFKSPTTAKYCRLELYNTGKTSTQLVEDYPNWQMEQSIETSEYINPKLIGTNIINYAFDDVDKFKKEVLSIQTINLFDVEFVPYSRIGNVSGKYIKPDGSSSTSSHKEFIEIESNTSYVFSNHSLSNAGITGRVYFYNADKEFISNLSISFGTAFTTLATARYVRFVLTHTNSPVTDLETYTDWQLEKGLVASSFKKPKLININTIDYDFGRITELENEIGNSYGKNIYDTTLINGITSAIKLNRNNRYMNIGFFTDTHSNVNDAKDSISYMEKLALSGVCDLCIHGGDLISSYDMDFEGFTEAMLKIINTYKQIKNMHFIKGNHDNNHAVSSDNSFVKYQYNMMFKNNENGAVFNESDPFGGYYYIDNPVLKVRIIILNAFYSYTEHSDLNFGEIQKSWLYNTALNTDDLDGYSVLIFSHHYTNNCEIVDILKAFNDKGTTYGDYTFDANSTAKFVGIIHGHNHYDTYRNVSGYNAIGVTKAFADIADIGTDDEVAIDIYTIDTDNSILYQTRIGKGSSHSYNYGNTVGQIN